MNNPEIRGSKHVRNFGSYVPGYTASFTHDWGPSVMCYSFVCLQNLYDFTYITGISFSEASEHRYREEILKGNKMNVARY
jgi:hypothetical protein